MTRPAQIVLVVGLVGVFGLSWFLSHYPPPNAAADPDSRRATDFDERWEVVAPDAGRVSARDGRRNPFAEGDSRRAKGSSDTPPRDTETGQGDAAGASGPAHEVSDGSGLPSIDMEAVKDAVLLSDSEHKSLLERWHALPKKKQRAIRDECHRRGIGRGKIECLQLVDVADSLGTDDASKDAP